MYRLPSPDLDHGRDGSASLEVAAASMVLGGASDGDAFQRHVGVAACSPAWCTYKTAWLLAQKLRRSMIDPDRSLLEGVVEVDQTEIPFRTDDGFFDPRQAGKIIVAGAVGGRGSDDEPGQAAEIERKISRHPFRPSSAGGDPEQLGGFSARFRPTSDWVLRCSPTATAPIRASPATATIHARSARWRATSPCHGFIASSR
jgi:hypothetical protein